MITCDNLDLWTCSVSVLRILTLVMSLETPSTLTRCVKEYQIVLSESLNEWVARRAGKWPFCHKVNDERSERLISSFWLGKGITAGFLMASLPGMFSDSLKG